MRKKLLTILAFLLIVSLNIAFAKTNKSNKYKATHKRYINLKPKAGGERIKRALNDDDERPLRPNRGQSSIPVNLPYGKDVNNKVVTDLSDFRYSENEQPFWATRGRRGSASAEDYVEYIENINQSPKSTCKDCLAPLPPKDKNLKTDMGPYSPFWGNRGRRDSSEVVVGYANKPFWDTRDRKQDQDPFWGNRGRRKDDTILWGNHGQLADEPFWGNRGRRDNEPFWGNRGRRQDSEPFWGNRGRRQESDPFWGNRGRREDSDPFWGNRGRRNDLDFFRLSQGRRKEVLKESILNALNDVEKNIENLSILKRSGQIVGLNSYWKNRGSDSKMKYLFNESSQSRNSYFTNKADTRFKTSDPGTVHDNRIYAEQPHYILIDRNIRSSSEEDPYFISRGKKYYINYNLIKAARDRRGAIEEIVKSVRNDPFYIVRGKKDVNEAKPANINEQLFKVKELVCAAVDLITVKKGDKSKRDINDNERDRRTILKKLAAQLQSDPYFVSRGKKNEESPVNDENSTNFINDLAEKCNN